MALFQTCLQGKKLCKDIISLQPEERVSPVFEELLCRSDEKGCSKSTLTTVRLGLCRFIKSKRPELDIIKDDEFDEANLSFRARTEEDGTGSSRTQAFHFKRRYKEAL